MAADAAPGLAGAGDVNGGVAKDPFTRNRRHLESLFPGAIATQVTDQPWMIMIKAGYCFAYAIGMWALVLGAIGLFHRWMCAPSPAMRYLAESSYWLYLLHIPVMFQLEMWVGRFPLSPAGKFAFYNLVVVAVLLPTYNYLVRSTLIGQVLHGRKHPFIGFLQSPLFTTPTDRGEMVRPSASPADSSERLHIPQHEDHWHLATTKVSDSSGTLSKHSVRADMRD